MSSNLGQGGDYWGDPMSIVQGASADDLIRAGYGRDAAPAPAALPAPEGKAMTDTTRPDGVEQALVLAVKQLEVMRLYAKLPEHEEVIYQGVLDKLVAAIAALTAPASKPAEPVVAQKSPSVSDNAVCGSSVSVKPAEGGPTDDQIWNLRGLSPFDATTETREEFIIRARAALDREGGAA